MTNLKFHKETWFYKPLLAALFLGISRLPLHLGFLVFFGLIPLFSFFDDHPSIGNLIKAGMVFGISYTFIALHWVALVTVPGLFGLFILFSLYFFLLFLVLSFGWNHLHHFRFFFVIITWVAFEYIQTFGEFRFPWFNLGYSLAEYLPLIQLADLGGIYLLSGCIALVNSVVYGWREKPLIAGVVTVCILAGWMGYGAWRLHTLPVKTTTAQVGIVQGSIPQEKKWDDEYRDWQLDIYSKLSRELAEDGAKLVILPESAIPGYVFRRPYLRHYVTSLSKDLNVDIFTGFPHYTRRLNSSDNPYLFYNSCTRIDTNGHFYPLYYKNILVPFGERMPLLSIFPFLWNFQLGQANFEYGDTLAFYQFGEYRYSPEICFEVAFPAHTRHMTQQGIDFIVNITNDAWFKRSAGTYQHAMMARIRAVETRRQLYRAANSGISMVISPKGEILRRTKLFDRTTLMHPVQQCPVNSPFTKFGYWFAFACAVASGILLGVAVVMCKIKKGGETQKA